MPVQAGLGQQGVARRHFAYEIDHGRVAARGVVLPERQAGDGAHVVLELAGVGALDGPVARSCARAAPFRWR